MVDATREGECMSKRTHTLGWRALVLSLAILMLTACAKIPTADVQSLRDKYCACKDKACVQTLVADIKAFGNRDPEDLSSAEKLIAETMQCAIVFDSQIPVKLKTALESQ